MKAVSWVGQSTASTSSRWLSLLLAALVMAALAGGGYAIIGNRETDVRTSPWTSPMKIMPLGDSITLGQKEDGTVEGGYRTRLWNRLVNEEQLNVAFVGSQVSGSPPLNHEGHGGWRIDQIQAIIDDALSANTPDVVLLHIGSNDIGQKYELNDAPGRLQTLAARICAAGSGISLIISSLIPIGGLESIVDTYNSRIPGMVAGLQQSGCNAHFVDMNSVVSTSDLFDGVHPRDSAKMADVWYPQVATIYRQGQARPTSSAVPRSVNDDVLGYKGYWQYTVESSTRYWGDEHYSGNTGDTATLLFKGSGFVLYGTRTPRGGVAAVSLDGGPETLVDFYAPSDEIQVVAYRSPPLSDTSHTLKVRVTGRSTPAASDTVVSVDRIVLGG